jgi:lipopolysaccharide export system ATP-binding protein
MSESILSISKLNFSVGSVDILSGVNISTEGNIKRLGLVGANGAGKSTLFKCIMGFEKNYSGEIFLNGESLAKKNPSERTALGLGYLAQESWLFWDMTCYENLLAPLQLSSSNKQDIHKQCEESLNEVGLLELKDRKASKLSGGEKRRLEIARTMIMKPTVLLLDEPFAGLDPHACEDLKDLLKVISDKGVVVWVSDHQLVHILEMSETVYLMDKGLVALSGSPEEVQNNAKAKDLYF